jgi:hypothetical protein
MISLSFKQIQTSLISLEAVSLSGWFPPQGRNSTNLTAQFLMLQVVYSFVHFITLRYLALLLFFNLVDLIQ